MDLIFVGDYTQEQSAGIISTIELLTLDLDAWPITLYVAWEADPSEQVADEFAVTEQVGFASWAMSFRNDAPHFSNGPSAEFFDTVRFYQETIAHEIGHVLTGALEGATGSGIAVLEKLYGVAADGWYDPGKLWADQVRESIAETFKDAFLPQEHREYSNRTNLILQYPYFPAFRGVYRNAVTDQQLADLTALLQLEDGDLASTFIPAVLPGEEGGGGSTTIYPERPYNFSTDYSEAEPVTEEEVPDLIQMFYALDFETVGDFPSVIVDQDIYPMYVDGDVNPPPAFVGDEPIDITYEWTNTWGAELPGVWSNDFPYFAEWPNHHHYLDTLREENDSKIDIPIRIFPDPDFGPNPWVVTSVGGDTTYFTDYAAHRWHINGTLISDGTVRVLPQSHTVFAIWVTNLREFPDSPADYAPSDLLVSDEAYTFDFDVTGVATSVGPDDNSTWEVNFDPGISDTLEFAIPEEAVALGGIIVLAPASGHTTVIQDPDDLTPPFRFIGASYAISGGMYQVEVDITLPYTEVTEGGGEPGEDIPVGQTYPGTGVASPGPQTVGRRPMRAKVRGALITPT